MNGRNTAADGCFKQETDAVFLCKFQKIITSCSHKFLIGCYHTLSCLQTFGNKIIGNGQSAHGFNHDLHFRIFQNDVDIVDHFVGIRTVGKITKIEDIFDIHKIRACFFSDLFSVFFNQFHDAASYDTTTHNGNIHSIYS